MKKYKIKSIAYTMSIIVLIAFIIPFINPLTTQAFENSAHQNEITRLEVFNPDGTMEWVEGFEVNLEEPPLFAPFSTTNFELLKWSCNINHTCSNNCIGFNAVTAHDNSDSSKFVMTIMGDGFTQNQQNAFIAAATDVTINILSTYPFNLFKNDMNIYAIKVVSNQSGASKPTGSPNLIVDNYFGSTFNYYYDGVQRLLSPTKHSTVREVLNQYTPYYNAPMILVNHTEWGGSGGSYAVSSLTDGKEEIMVHELGHSVGKLGDEYWPSREIEYPNKTQNNNLNTNKWRNYIGINNIDIYRIKDDINWFIPHENCMMRNTSNPFCSVCASVLIDEMSKAGNFTPKQHTISYNANGGASTPVSQAKIHGINLTLTNNIPTAKYYTITYNAMGGSVSPSNKTYSCTFKNWNTNAAGTGVSFSRSGTYSANASTTLYAQWNNPTIGTLPTPTRTNYNFTGWYNTSAITGGTQITSATPVTANMTIYARWTPITRTVTFNANGGSVSPSSRTVNQGNAVGTLPIPTRSNYAYNGWFTASTGGSRISASTVINANTTYYARWTQITAISLTLQTNVSSSVRSSPYNDGSANLITTIPSGTRFSCKSRTVNYLGSTWYWYANAGGWIESGQLYVVNM